MKDVRRLVNDQIIIHTAFVLDGSGSMSHLRKAVVKVVDDQVANLAGQSNKLNQETRATFYWFDDEVYCAYYDKDVLRLPSIADFYDIGGMTALCTASLKAIKDLEKTATLYGQHDFLIFVVSDGMENASPTMDKVDLKQKLSNLPIGWNVAVLVPDREAKRQAVYLGFSEENILIWDTTTAKGLEKAAEQVQTAYTNYAVARSQGIRPTGGLFAIDTKTINTAAQAGAITPLDKTLFDIYPVFKKTEAATFSAQAVGKFLNRTIYYQLTKQELVQGYKNVLIKHKGTGVVYGPKGTRQTLGLPDDGSNVEIRPNVNKDYIVFVQSTAPNRALLAGTEAIITKTIL